MKKGLIVGLAVAICGIGLVGCNNTKVPEVLTAKQESAVASVKKSLDSEIGYSKKSLKALMIYDGYSESDIDIALSKFSIDEREEAVKLVKFCQKSSKFSKEEVRQILEREQFNKIDIQYAMSQCYK